MYLLDTDTCIFLARGHARVIERLRNEQRGDVHVSILSVYELELGLKKATKQVTRKRKALDDIMELFHVVPFAMDEAREAAKVRAELEKKGQPIGAIDYLIAGTARCNRLTLVTGNLREFKKVRGLKLEDWSA